MGASACGLEVERRRPGPGAFHDDVFEPVVDQLEDARAAVDMRNDLEQVIRFLQAGADLAQVERLVLEAHGPRGDAHRSVVERPDRACRVSTLSVGWAYFFGKPHSSRPP